MQITFEVPDLYEVTARNGEVVVPVDIAKLSADILAQLLMYGIKQKVTDAASGAANSAALAITGNIRPGESKDAFARRLKDAAISLPVDAVNKEAYRMMTKCRDALLAGDWGKERESAPGLDQKLVDYIRTTNGPAFGKAWPGFGDMKTPDQRKTVATWLMENPDRLDKARAKYAAHLAEQAKLANVNLDDLLG